MSPASHPSTARQQAEDLVREFVATEYGRVVAAVTMATHDADHAQDAVQDAILQVIDRAQTPANMAAWVTTVAINNVRMVHRRSATEQRAVARTEPHAIVQATDLATGLDIERAVDALPDKQRTVAALHYILDISVADIAIAMEVSEGTVKTHLHRARTALAQALLEDPS